MSTKKLNKNDAKKVKKWLGKKGIKLFFNYKNKYGTVSPVFMESGIPHAVHFREGMQVRNFLRTLPSCSKWNSEDLDNSWQDIIDLIVENKV